MLVDCFLGFDEVELARFRVTYLDKLVNRVLIVESSKTFSGDCKPLYFFEWWKSLPNFLKEKIDVVKLDDSLFKSSDAWDRDIFSRESLIEIAIKKYPAAKYIFSDLDEIPSLEQVETFLITDGNYHFRCRTVYRKANLFVQGRHDNWDYGVLASFPELLINNGGRFQKLPLIGSSETGVHFSYLGMSPERIESKLNSFAHTEYRSLEIDFTNYLAFCDKYTIDHLGRIRSETFGLLELENKDTLTSSILKSLIEFNSNWFYSPVEKKIIIKRLFASGIASFGMRVSRGSRIHPIRRLLFSVYFSRHERYGSLFIQPVIRLIVISCAVIEIFLAILWNIRRLVKKFVRNEKK